MSSLLMENGISVICHMQCQLNKLSSVLLMTESQVQQVPKKPRWMLHSAALAVIMAAMIVLQDIFF